MIEAEENPQKAVSFWQNRFLHLVLIIIVGLIAYSNTFNVPFQWDDDQFITKNPIIENLSFFAEPSKAVGVDYSSSFKMRYMGYLSFALNYYFHGLNVTGYHIVNISIHIINAVLVYLFAYILFKTPYLIRRYPTLNSRHIALFAGLLFVSHPVQIEAVTYIYQRMASLMTMFYLLSILSYAGSRISTSGLRKFALYAFSLIFAVMAMKTKENAFTLPVVITVMEFFFFEGTIGERITRLSPILLTMLIIPINMLSADKPIHDIFGNIGSMTVGNSEISRMDYLLTESTVIVKYLRLLLFPINQNIDYAYTVYHSVFVPHVFFSLFLFVYIFFIGVYSFKHSRLICFGIFWFFITLSVESSLIPLPMVINEYRIYLPSVGFFVAFSFLFFLLSSKLKNKAYTRAVLSIPIIAVLVFSYATYSRNKVWGSKITLWEDTVSKSPSNARAYYNLGNSYVNEGIVEKAIESYETAIRLRPDLVEAHNNLGNAYLLKDRFDEAIAQYDSILKIQPGNSTVHSILGDIYYHLEKYEEAVEHFKLAISLDPSNTKIHFKLGLSLEATGKTGEAKKEFETVLTLEPNNAEAIKYLDYLNNKKALP